MCTKWKLTVKTSLPNVCYGEEDLVTSSVFFDDFGRARAALRAELRELAFSRNEMFDGYGNIIYMEKYMIMIMLEDDEIGDDLLQGWFSGETAMTVLKVFSCILEGKDVDFDFVCGSYFNQDIEVEINKHTIGIHGTGEGKVNGYDPQVDTNLLSMQEEKDYYLYINDWFGQWADASSELYIDLEKIEGEQLSFL